MAESEAITRVPDRETDLRNVVSLGSGDDVVVAGTQPVLLLGNAGDDTIVGGVANDTILGGSGDDFIDLNGGSDIAFGGAGADNFSVRDNRPSGLRTISDFNPFEDIFTLSSIGMNCVHFKSITKCKVVIFPDLIQILEGEEAEEHARQEPEGSLIDLDEFFTNTSTGALLDLSPLSAEAGQVLFLGRTVEEFTQENTRFEILLDDILFLG
jgi:hypothetical protein